MNTLGKLTDLLRTLQDPTRLRLLWVLRQGELSVGEIVQVTSLSQPRVSRHLKMLCDARIVRRTPDRNEVYYRAAIDEDRRELVATILSNLSARDPIIASDQQRLASILNLRQTRSRVLLDRLGVQPLDVGDMAEVSAAIDVLLARHLPRNTHGEHLGDMLDVGTGTGSMLRLLAGRARRIVAVDLSRDMRLIARATVLSERLANCTVREGDMYHLEFPGGRFDLVIMDRVLGTADDPVAALSEAARVMNDNAHLLVAETRTAAIGEQQLEQYLALAGLSSVELQAAAQDSVLVLLAARGKASGSVPRMKRSETPGDR